MSRMRVSNATVRLYEEFMSSKFSITMGNIYNGKKTKLERNEELNETSSMRVPLASLFRRVHNSFPASRATSPMATKLFGLEKKNR